MRRKIYLLLSVLLTLLCSCDAGISCEFNLGAFNLEVVRDSGGHQFAYRLSGADAFPMTPLGWHATAAVACRTCTKSGFVSGLVWLGTDSKAATKPNIAPGTKIKGVLVPWYVSPYDVMTASDDPKPMSFGPLKGWMTHFAASYRGNTTHDIVEAKATDGCASIFLRIEATHSNDNNLFPQAAALMHSIRVSITRAENDPKIQAFFNSPVESSRPLKKLTFEQFRAAIGR